MVTGSATIRETTTFQVVREAALFAIWCHGRFVGAEPCHGWAQLPSEASQSQCRASKTTVKVFVVIPDATAAVVAALPLTFRPAVGVPTGARSTVVGAAIL